MRAWGVLLSALLCSGVVYCESLQGIQVSDMDQKANPCVDFYDYANGAWRANNPIPASMDRWSRRWAAGESNKEKVRTILEEAATKTDQPKGSVTQLTGDFYAACMDVATINKLGIKPSNLCCPRSMGSRSCRAAHDDWPDGECRDRRCDRSE